MNESIKCVTKRSRSTQPTGEKKHPFLPIFFFYPSSKKHTTTLASVLNFLSWMAVCEHLGHWVICNCKCHLQNWCILAQVIFCSKANVSLSLCVIYHQQQKSGSLNIFIKIPTYYNYDTALFSTYTNSTDYIVMLEYI